MGPLIQYFTSLPILRHWPGWMTNVLLFTGQYCNPAMLKVWSIILLTNTPLSTNRSSNPIFRHLALPLILVLAFWDPLQFADMSTLPFVPGLVPMSIFASPVLVYYSYRCFFFSTSIPLFAPQHWPHESWTAGLHPLPTPLIYLPHNRCTHLFFCFSWTPIGAPTASFLLHSSVEGFFFRLFLVNPPPHLYALYIKGFPIFVAPPLVLLKVVPPFHFDVDAVFVFLGPFHFMPKSKTFLSSIFFSLVFFKHPLFFLLFTVVSPNRLC